MGEGKSGRLAGPELLGSALLFFLLSAHCSFHYCLKHKRKPQSTRCVRLSSKSLTLPSFSKSKRTETRSCDIIKHGKLDLRFQR